MIETTNDNETATVTDPCDRRDALRALYADQFTRMARFAAARLGKHVAGRRRAE